VVLYDVSEAALDAGLARLRAGLARGPAADQAEQLLARVTGVTDLDGLATAGLTIEAAPEDIELKRAVFRRLDEVVAPDAILATNTSTLSVAAIAGAVQRPQRVAGLHFFNPAPRMPLVEVVRGFATAEPVIADLVALAEAWGKTPIVVADTPGFIVNRVARPYYGEALRLLGDGVATTATIDRLARDAGFPMGPFELMDLIGIDVNLAAATSVYEGFYHDPRFRPHAIQRRMVESGRLGRKTGHGYYEYPEAPS
jgi:3-hydroxybutyryl-CoA dehydrogenase